MTRQTADTTPVAEPFAARLTTRYAIIGALAGLLFPAMATLLELTRLNLGFDAAGVLKAQQSQPVLWITDTAPLFLGLVAALAGWQQDRLVQANKSLRERETELSSIRTNLEASVLERTRELDERNAEMRSVIDFARQTAEVQDLPTLARSSVETLHARFAQYDADLYLIDARTQAAVLHASSRTEGKAQAASGYRVLLSDQGVVARVARRGKLLISTARADGPEQALQMPGPSAGVSQIALPLSVRGSVIGVLALQQPQARPVPQSEVDVLQLMADQLAASIEGVRQAGEARLTVEQLERLAGENVRAAWQQYLRSSAMAYQFTPAGVHAVATDAPDAPTGDAGVPLVLRGQKIGSIRLRKRSGEKLGATERDLMEKVAAQVALALENVRLLEETRRRAAQEQVIGEISARFSRSLDVDALLQAAVREFAALPDVAEATVLLKATEAQASEASN